MSNNLYVGLKRRRVTNRRPYKRPVYSRGRLVPPATSRFVNSYRTGGLQLGVERKWYDTAIAATSIVTAPAGAGMEVDPTALCVSAPALGDGPNMRDGQKILISSVSLKGVITIPVTVNQVIAKQIPVIFVCLVQDKQTNLVQLNSEDVLSNLPGDARGSVFLFRNPEYMKRFTILDSKTITPPQPMITWDGTNIEQGGSHTTFYLKWKGKIPVTFTNSGTTSTIGAVTDNSIHVLAACSNGDVVASIIYGCRIRFYG